MCPLCPLCHKFKRSKINGSSDEAKLSYAEKGHDVIVMMSLDCSVPPYLGDLTEDSDRLVKLSPHLFGWPCHRPRQYTVLTLRSACELDGDGLNALFDVMRVPNISVSDLFCAPQD